MKKIILLILAVSLLGGCVYYNTFYNARQYFKQAQEEELRDNGKPSHNAIQNYNKAMKKCGIILTDYKKSKWADDALFMLSQCLYYRQTKLSEAKEKFEEVIQFYPDTDFALQSHIYIARCLRDMNQHDKAYQKLREYIVSAKSRKYLPEALMQIAEYYLEDEDFSQAEFYYQKLIDEYPNSEYHEAAYFALGILYHSNKEYEKAINTFSSFTNIRSEKKKKLEAKYYIASSYLLSGDYEVAEKKIKSLLDDEYREEEISKVLLLKARVFAETGKTEEADIIFEQLITENSKTSLSAEASYWRAEMHFRKMNDYEAAIEYYNNVRTEYNKSPFVEDAVTHSAVASQIIQYHSVSKDIELTQLISEQMKLAEYYIEVLELPDSAMTVYDNIIDYRQDIILRRDSLQTQFDSLSVRSSLQTISDSIATRRDSLFTTNDSLTIVLEDSTDLFKPQLPAKQDSLLQKINSLNQDIVQYDENIIPYVQFVKLWMYKNVYQDSTATENIYRFLKDNYPQNRYSYAAEKLLSGKEVEFVTRKEEEERGVMKTALNLVPENPDSALVILKKLSADTTGVYYQKAMFSRSYIHFHVFDDTLSAKPLIDSLIAIAPASEWAQHISLFYDGEHFMKLDRLPAIVEIENRALEEAEKEKETEEIQEDSELIMELEDIEVKNDNDGGSENTPRSPRPLPNK